MALEQTSNPLSWYKPLDDIRGNPPETEEERRRRLEQEALQRQMSDLMEEDTEEVQVRKKVEEIKEKREAVDQPEDKEERFVVEEPQEEKSLSWFVPQDKEPQAEEPQTKKPQPKIPEDEVTWDRKVAYGMAQEPTIAGSLWRLGSAKLQSLFDEKTYKEVAREIEYARQERILEMFPEFRGREEDAGVIAGRVGMAIADPVTFLIPWIKIAKLGRMAQLGIGSGIAMGDVSLREEALYGEVDPRIVGLAGVLGAASTGLGIGIQSRFSKGKSDKVDEFVEVIDKQGKKKKVPIKIDETPSGKVPVTTEDINKLNRTGEQVLEETLEEVTGLVKFFDNYGKITHEMNTLLTKVRLVEKNIRTLKKKSKGAFDIRNIPGATFTIQQLRNFKNLQEQVIRVTPRIVKGETKDLMEVPSMFVVRMSPTDYLNLTATKKLQKKLVKDVKGRQTSFEEFLKKTKGLSKQQVKKLQKQSKDAGVWSDWRRWNFNKQASLNFGDSGMSLRINKAGRLFGQEGRHRATLLKMLGAKDMPVILEIGDGGAAALAQTMYNKSGKIANTFKDYGIKQIRGGKYNRKASVNVAKWEIAPLYRGDLEGFRGLNTRGQSYIALTKAYEVAQNVKKVKPTKPQIKAYDAKKALAHAEDEVRVGYAHHKKLLARQTELFTDDIPVNIAAVGWASIKSAWNNGTLTENLARQLQYELVRPLVGGVSGGVFGILTDDDEDNLWTNHLIGSIITGVALGTLQKKIQRSSAELKQPISNKIIRILDKERDKIYRHTNLYMLKSLTAGTHMSWMQASTPINAKLGFKLYRDQGAARAVGKSVANLPVEQADAAVTAVWRRQLYSILKGVEPEDAIAAGRLVNEKGMPATSKHTFLLEGDLENKVATKVADQLEGLRRAYLKYSQEAGVPMNIEDSYGLTQILHPKIASRTDAVRPLIEDAIRIQNANWKDKMRFGKKFAPIEEGNIPQAAAHYIDASTRKRNDSIFIRSNAKLEGRSIFRDRAGDEEEFFTRAAQNLSKDRMIFDPEARAFLMNQGVFVENPRLTFMKLFNYNTRIVEFTRKFGARGEGIQETFKQNRAWFTEQAIKNNMMKKGDRLPASFEASLDKANSRVMDSVDALFGVYGATGSSSDLGRTATLYGQAILATTKLEKVVIPSIGDLAQTIQNSGWGPFVQAEIKQIREKIFRLNDTTRYSKNLGINLYTDDAGFIDKAVGWSRNKRYDDKVVSAELSGFLIEGPNLAPQEWMRRFFEIVQLGRITRHAREVSYDAGVINLYQIGKKLNRRRRNKKGARTVPLSIQKELSDLDVTAKEAMHVARFKSADKAWEDDTIARRIMDRAGLNSADRDALIPTVGNRRLFAQSQDPFIRLLGSFLSWAQAKSTQTNALIARLEHGDNVLAVRMLSVFPVYAGINYLRMSLMSSDKFSEEYTTNPMRYKNLAEIALFKAESAPWYADKMFNSLRHMTGTPTPTVALWPVAGLLNDFTEIVLETAEGEYKEAAVDTFETLIPFGEDLSGLAGWPEDIKKEQEREARRKDREKRLPSRRRPDYFEGGKVSPDYAVSNVVEDPSERGNARTGLPFDEPFERNGMKGGGVMVSVGIAPVSEKQISKLQKVLKERKAKREGGEVRQQYGIGRLVKALIRNRENVKKLREKPVEKPVEKIVEKPVEKVAEVEKTEAIAKVKEGLEWEQHVDNHIEGDEDRRLARAIVMAESSGDPTKVNAKSGAVGLMQILPSTAGQPGYGVKPFEGDDLSEQKKNIEFGWNYFTGMRNHFGNDRDAHIAYNWGPGNTEEWLSTGGNLENIPEETRDYLGKISNYGK